MQSITIIFPFHKGFIPPFYIFFFFEINDNNRLQNNIYQHYLFLLIPDIKLINKDNKYFNNQTMSKRLKIFEVI